MNSFFKKARNIKSQFNNCNIEMCNFLHNTGEMDGWIRITATKLHFIKSLEHISLIQSTLLWQKLPCST